MSGRMHYMAIGLLVVAATAVTVGAVWCNFSKSSGGAVAGRLVFGGWRRTGFCSRRRRDHERRGSEDAWPAAQDACRRRDA